MDKNNLLTKNDLYRGVDNDIPNPVSKYGDRSDTILPEEEIYDDNIAVDSEMIRNQIVAPNLLNEGVPSPPSGYRVNSQPTGQLSGSLPAVNTQRLPAGNGQTGSVVYPSAVIPPRDNIYRPGSLPGAGRLPGAGVLPGSGGLPRYTYQEPVYYPQTTENPGIIYKVGETAINFSKGLFSWPLSG